MALQIAVELGDAELVLRALSGESQAFGRLIEKYQGLIYGLAYNKVGNTADAQDIAQDVFVRAFQKLKQLDDPACFSAWIKTITANECKTWLRNLRPTVSLDESEYSPAHDSAAQSIWRYDEFRAEVAQAIQALSERNREVITLYYLSGMTCEEIAESLETTPSAVQSRLHRARQLLRAEFTGEIEQTLGGRRLPDEFSREVLRRASAFTPRGRFVSGYGGDGTGAGNVFLCAPRPSDGVLTLISISMASPDARGIACPYLGEPSGDCSKVLMKAQMAEYRAKGMEPIEFILYLDEHDNCKGQGVFRHGRAKVKEEMKASRAIALCLHAMAPILVEDRILELREVGEDGFHYELDMDLDRTMVRLRVSAGYCTIQDRMFQIGMEVSKGLTTARITKDIEQRTVHLSIDGLEGAFSVLEFTDDPLWVDDLWKRAARDGWTRDVQPDGRQYRISYRLDGESIQATCRLEPWPRSGPLWSGDIDY